jgi:uncharacterized membrane protein
MAGYVSRVREDIRRWSDIGLIDVDTAEALARDVESRAAGISFGQVLAVMAAVLLGASILIFIAANWEEIPRLARVLGLFVLIASGYVGGAVLKIRGHPAFGEAAWLTAAAAFGASIALIGQMYHLSGDAAGAVLAWCVGTAAAALLLRSGQLTSAAVLLAAAWLLVSGSESSGLDFPETFMALAAVLWALSRWTGSAVSRHMLLFSLILFAFLMALEHEIVPAAILLMVVSAGLFVIAAYRPDDVERLADVGGATPFYGLLGFLVGIFLLQAEFLDSSPASFAAAAAVAFAGIVASLVLAGRSSRAMRWLAYAGFAAETLLVYWVMVGTMLGTAGFFLAAALLMGGSAFAITRIEARVRAAA